MNYSDIGELLNYKPILILFTVHMNKSGAILLGLISSYAQPSWMVHILR
jgi:hypothetical protein